MISFTKSLNIFSKSVNKASSIDSDEYEFRGHAGTGTSYAEKLAVRGLTFNQMKMMYISNVWVRAIVDRIVDRSSDIQFLIKPLNQKIDQSTDEVQISDETKRNIDKISDFLQEPNSNHESLINIRKKLSRDLLLYDASSFEIIKGMSKGETFIEIYSVPGNTIKLNVNENGILSKTNSYLQLDSNSKIVAKWNKDQIMYMMLNPVSDKVYGLSPLESLIQTVTAELYASDYNLNFFENNATPRFAVLMEGLGLGQGDMALKRFRTWWDSELKGNPHRPIIIGTENGKIQFQKVSLSNEEMQFQEYSKQLLSKIMSVYKMQPVVLGVDNVTNSKSNAEEQINMFKTDAVKPILTALIDKLNFGVIHNKNAYGIKDIYLDYDLDIIDKKKQAEWHDIYLKSGVITINEIRTQGLGLVPVSWGNVPYMQNNIAPFGVGPNGQAVPGDPNKNDMTGNKDEKIPNVNIANKNYLEKYIESTEQIIGWEKMEISERLEIVEKLINEREKVLSKTYSFPKKLRS